MLRLRLLSWLRLLRRLRWLRWLCGLRRLRWAPVLGRWPWLWNLPLSPGHLVWWKKMRKGVQLTTRPGSEQHGPKVYRSAPPKSQAGAWYIYISISSISFYILHCVFIYVLNYDIYECSEWCICMCEQIRSGTRMHILERAAVCAWLLLVWSIIQVIQAGVQLTSSWAASV